MGTTELIEQLRGLLPKPSPWSRRIKGRVVKVHTKGGLVTAAAARYAVDVQPLLPDGSDDPDLPVVPDVELPVVWGGPGRGVFAAPQEGTVVRLGWYYDDPRYPYVDAVLADGRVVPDHPVGEFLIEHPHGQVSISPTGVVRVNGTSVELGEALTTLLRSTFVSWAAAHTHSVPLTPPVVTGPPLDLPSAAMYEASKVKG